VIRLAISLATCCLVISGCAAHVVEIDITNHLGAPLRNIEVTFGGGTYGRSSIAAGATHQNRVKIFNPAPIQLQFDGPDGKHQTLLGPVLSKDAEGRVTITIDAVGAVWSGP